MTTEAKPAQLVPDTSKMEYRYLGNTGLRVSVLSYGNWCEHDDDKRTVECVKWCKLFRYSRNLWIGNCRNNFR